MDDSSIGVLEWSDPPPKAKPRTGAECRPWALVVAQLKAKPGKWGKIAAGRGSQRLRARILSGWSRFTPAGAWEAEERLVDGVLCVWAKYVGEPGEPSGGRGTGDSSAAPGAGGRR
jgi:hypothetical protein